MRIAMPIENELKFVLDISKLQEIKEELLKIPHAEHMKIWQGYIGKYDRIRHIQKGKSEKFLFTFKLKINNQTVEIEKEISSHDFMKLVEAVNEKIVKERISIRIDEETWDVDFLIDPKSGETYLILAEIEMPEWQDSPSHIPHFIDSYVVYNVKKFDKRFNNRQLEKSSETKKLYQSLIKKKETRFGRLNRAKIKK